jgi:hypothetical protein
MAARKIDLLLATSRRNVAYLTDHQTAEWNWEHAILHMMVERSEFRDQADGNVSAVRGSTSDEVSRAAAGTATYALSIATDPPNPAGVGWANDEEVDCGCCRSGGRCGLHRGRLGVVPAVAYVVVAVASAVGAGAMTFLVVCPSHLGRRQRAVFLPFVGLFGLAAGVLAMALVVAGLAVWRMHRLPDVHISVPTVSGIEGDYVALGDSYSAGEGLRPFSWYTGDAGTSRDDGCHRSARAYSQLLVFAGGQTATRFAACA